MGRSPVAVRSVVLPGRICLRSGNLACIRFQPQYPVSTGSVLRSNPKDNCRALPKGCSSKKGKSQVVSVSELVRKTAPDTTFAHHPTAFLLNPTRILHKIHYLRKVRIAFTAIDTKEGPQRITVILFGQLTVLAHHMETPGTVGTLTVAKQLIVPKRIQKSRNTLASIVTLVIAIAGLKGHLTTDSSPSVRTGTVHAVDVGDLVPIKRLSIDIARMVVKALQVSLVGCEDAGSVGLALQCALAIVIVVRVTGPQEEQERERGAKHRRHVVVWVDGGQFANQSVNQQRKDDLKGIIDSAFCVHLRALVVVVVFDEDNSSHNRMHVKANQRTNTGNKPRHTYRKGAVFCSLCGR